MWQMLVHVTESVFGNHLFTNHERIERGPNELHGPMSDHSIHRSMKNKVLLIILLSVFRRREVGYGENSH